MPNRAGYAAMIREYAPLDEAPAIPSTPEQKLWTSVLLMALRDACGAVSYVKSTKRQMIINNAQRFFQEPSPALRAICELIDVDYDTVRTVAIQRINEFNRTGKPQALTIKGLKAESQERLAA
ncbi:MAG: hypothetical protein AAGI11_06380 [Pseudomonadota bacterium]